MFARKGLHDNILGFRLSLLSWLSLGDNHRAAGGTACWLEGEHDGDKLGWDVKTDKREQRL